MGAIQLYEKTFPVIIWIFEGEQSEQDVDFHLRTFSELHRKQQRYATITWFKKFDRNRAHLQRVASWFKENQEETSRFNIGGALISTSPIFRFLLSSFFLVSPTKAPTHVCASFQEALPWMREHLRLHQLSFPEELSTLNPDKLVTSSWDTPRR